jgi:hypothetical protein
MPRAADARAEGPRPRDVLRRALALGALACGLLGPAAHAGTPFTVGTGQDPHLLVDGSGTAHVVWTSDTTLVYCQVPRGATACANAQRVAAGIAPDSPFVVQRNGELAIVMPRDASGDTYAWRSFDGGATWPGEGRLYGFGGGSEAAEPVAGPAADELTFAAWNASPAVWAAKADGSEGASDRHATLAGGGGHDLTIAATGDGGLVAVTNDLATAAFFRMSPGGDPSEQPAWSGPTPIGPGRHTRVAGGPGGAYLLATVPEPSGGAHQEVRRWTGGDFDAPFTIPEPGPVHDIHVGPSGALAVIYRTDDAPNRLRLALSTDGGASYGLSTIARDDAAMDDMHVALAPDDRGWAVYEGGPGPTEGQAQLRMVSTDPLAEPDSAPAAAAPSPASLRRVTRDVGGAELRLDVPGNCIARSSGRLTARLAVRRFPRRGTFVAVRGVDFYVGRRRISRDRRPPFVQTIRIANPVAGRTYAVRTRAYVKRRRQLRLQRVTLRTRVTVCA